jgi:hypothetical protein
MDLWDSLGKERGAECIVGIGSSETNRYIGILKVIGDVGLFP